MTDLQQTREGRNDELFSDRAGRTVYREGPGTQRPGTQRPGTQDILAKGI